MRNQVAYQINKLGENFRAGLGDLSNARLNKERMGLEGRRLDYNLARMKSQDDRQAQVDEYTRPGLELGQLKGQRSLDDYNAPVWGNKLFPGQNALSHAMWIKQSDNAKNDPQIRNYMRQTRPGQPLPPGESPLFQAFGDMFGAKLDIDSQSPTHGQYVTATGKPLTQGEVASRLPEVKALFTARTGLGRALRGRKQDLEARLQSGQMSLPEYRANMQRVVEIERDPYNQIKILEGWKEYLSRFRGAEVQAGIERINRSIEKRWSEINAAKLAREKGKGEKEQSPSQKLKQIELDNVNIIFSDTATPKQKRIAFQRLNMVRDNSFMAQAIKMINDDIRSIKLSPDQKTRKAISLADELATASRGQFGMDKKPDDPLGIRE
jgi:hypothetical protein